MALFQCLKIAAIPHMVITLIDDINGTLMFNNLADWKNMLQLMKINGRITLKLVKTDLKREDVITAANAIIHPGLGVEACRTVSRVLL